MEKYNVIQMQNNTIFNEDCFITMERFKNNEVKPDVILTSPPYNMTKRKGGYADTGRYDVYKDWKTEEEYLSWTVELFNGFYRILHDYGVVLYNFSYSVENPALPYRLVAEITKETDFKLMDTIIWKKKSGLPFPANGQRLCRNWEYVFVFAKRDDYLNNRKVKSVSEKTGQKYYEAVYNFIEAPNNDGKCNLNQATFSSELCLKLLDIYAKKHWLVYDPFIGTGTTAVACLEYGCNYVGSEISEAQCKYAEERIKAKKDEIMKTKDYKWPIPQVGQFCHFWDDGKSSASRHYIAKVERLLSEEEARELMFDKNIYDDKPQSLYDIWRHQVAEHEYIKLYDNETDFFIEASIPKYDENLIYFVRSKNGWFSMDIQSWWQGGQLDVDGSRYQSILNEYEQYGWNTDGYTEETYE